MRTRGFTLIEVMMAFAMLAIGIVGLMQLEVIAARSGHSSTRVEEGSQIATNLSTALQALPYSVNSSTLLSDFDTSNDSAQKATSYNLDAPTATIDHCLGAASEWPPDLNPATICGEWDAFSSLPSISKPPGGLADGGQPLYFLGWDVEDADFGGKYAYPDGGESGSNGKVVVARVIWRDPAMGNYRSSTAVNVLYNPSAQ
jgi:prepilin-type N-terminal cleavage/methylation domain-containing protein